MAQLSKPVKPVSPSKNSKGSKPLGLDSKPTVQAVKGCPINGSPHFCKANPNLTSIIIWIRSKSFFLEIALPLILAGNEEVMRRRDAIARSNQNDDRAKLEKWAYLYDIKITDQDNSTLTKQLLEES